jgi:outer membrane protein
MNHCTLFNTGSILLLLCSTVSAQNHDIPPMAFSANEEAVSSTDTAMQKSERIPLSLQEAEQIALKNNPGIHLRQLLAKMQHERVRERRADILPEVSGNLTGVEAITGTRISSGTLTSSTLEEHAGIGLLASQRIYDFGRTQNLIASEKLQERARNSDLEASRQDILLAVNQVFYAALEAQASVGVARQTILARQALVDQVKALTASRLRSDLDLSFAEVNLSQAQLLQLRMQNNFDAAMASLDAVLGIDHHIRYRLQEDSEDESALPDSFDKLMNEAIANRPDLQSLEWQRQADLQASKAAKEKLLPTISAVGTVGYTPTGASSYFTQDHYGAVGGNISIPIFNGFRYSAEASEARMQIRVDDEKKRAKMEQIARDVKESWLSARTDLERLHVSQAMLAQANTALDLAKTRYDLGLSSIVELSQAQLQQTESAIANANALSQYRLDLATIRYQVGLSF